MTLGHWSRFAIAALMVAGCGAAGPVASPIAPTTMASPESSSGSNPSEVPACPNFVEVVETGRLPGDDGTEDGPLARAQQRLSGDSDAAVAYGAEHADEFASVRFENGPRVRLVIGFTGHVEEHCAALRALLEYPEEFEIIQQPMTEARLDAIMDELSDRYGQVLRSVGRGAGVLHVSVRADGEDVAAEIHATYGAIAEITLGLLPYPDRFTGPAACAALENVTSESPLAPTLELDPASLVSGADYRGAVTITNTGDEPFDFFSGPTQVAAVFAPGGTIPVGLYDGGLDSMGYGAMIAPGDSITLDVVGGTASCDPALGWAVPPGEYVVRVMVEVYSTDDSAPPEVEVVLSDPVTVTIVP